jgi:hypothetical protein
MNVAQHGKEMALIMLEIKPGHKLDNAWVKGMAQLNEKSQKHVNSQVTQTARRSISSIFLTHHRRKITKVIE